MGPRVDNQIKKKKKSALHRDREGEEREIEKIRFDDGLGKGERLQIFAGFGYHVRSLLRLLHFSEPKSRFHITPQIYIIFADERR